MNNDNAIKDKLNNLDTLDGGIVFGKEAAWHKLHDRLDAVPARKTRPLYWLAAAASLALLLLVAALYRQPAQQVAVAQPIAVPVPATTPVVQPQPEAVANTLIPAVKTKKVYNSSRERNTEQPIMVLPTPEPQLPVAVVEPPSEELVLPVPPVIKKKRVVHFADLDKDIAIAQEETNSALPNTALAEILKLPPVHISDVLTEDDYLQHLHKENRLTVGGISILLNTPQRPYLNDSRPFGGLRLRIY